MAPSAPGYPPERQSAQLMAGRREFTSFDQYESASITLGAVTTFQQVIEFSGMPESIVVDVSAAGVEVRARNRGESPYTAIRVQAAGERRLEIRAQIIEARDPAGAGGQLVTATGRFVSRSIDVRQNRPGPSRERPTLPDADRATQVPTSE